MQPNDSTCWMLIEGAARGDGKQRDEFVRRYSPALRAYFSARWKHSLLKNDVDDAVQEVYVDCFRQESDSAALGRASPDRPGGFRSYLRGIARVIALRMERRVARRREDRSPDLFQPETVPSVEASLSRVFDRAFAARVVADAASLQRSRSVLAEAGPRDGIGAARRVELLELRFRDGLAIREIARIWEMEARILHKEYSRARSEFRSALAEVVARHCSGTDAEIAEECESLISMLE